MKSLFLILIFFSTNAIAAVDLVKVDKSDRKMYLLDGSKVVRTYDIALGANPYGHKIQEGDERTPEGVYILDYLKLDSAFYKAMHVSYPNKKDILHSKSLGKPTGGDIKIHGIRNGSDYISKFQRWKDWTAGCIAVTNEEVDELYESVKIGAKIEIFK